MVSHKKRSTLDKPDQGSVLFVQFSIAAVKFIRKFFLADFRLERRRAVPNVFKVKLAVHLAVEDLHLSERELTEVFGEWVRGAEFGTQSNRLSISTFGPASGPQPEM